MNTEPDFLRKHDVLHIFGRKAKQMPKIESYLHRLILPGTVRFPQAYVVGLKAFSVLYQEEIPSIRAATAFAFTEQGQALMDHVERALDDNLNKQADGGQLGITLARDVLNLGKRELGTWITDHELQTDGSGQELALSVSGLQNLYKWQRPLSNNS